MVDYVKLDEDWPTYLHKKLKEDWVLSRACRDNCECYFLRHWEYNHFIRQCSFNDIEAITLHYGNHNYIVWSEELDKLKDYKQLALSFRAPAPELNLPAYVLVKRISS